MFIVAQPGTVRQLVVEDDDTSNGKRATRRGQREHDVPTTGVLDTPYMPFPRLLQSNDDTTWPVPAARTYRHLPLRSVAGNATYSSASEVHDVNGGGIPSLEPDVDHCHSVAPEAADSA